MPGVTIPGFGHIDFVGEYKPGDMPPKGYMDRAEWARVQEKAGLKQSKCGLCLRWNFPQEMSDRTDRTECENSVHMIWIVTTPICKECDAKEATR